MLQRLAAIALAKSRDQSPCPRGCHSDRSNEDRASSRCQIRHGPVAPRFAPRVIRWSRGFNLALSGLHCCQALNRREPVEQASSLARERPWLAAFSTSETLVLRTNRRPASRLASAGG